MFLTAMRLMSPLHSELVNTKCLSSVGQPLFSKIESHRVLSLGQPQTHPDSKPHACTDLGSGQWCCHPAFIQVAQGFYLGLNRSARPDGGTKEQRGPDYPRPFPVSLRHIAAPFPIFPARFDPASAWYFAAWARRPITLRVSLSHVALRALLHYMARTAAALPLHFVG